MKKTKHLKSKVIIAFFLMVILAGICILMTCPDLSVEKITQISQTLVIYDKDGTVSATLNTGENRVNVGIEEIPQSVIDALIATEDIRFYEHNGIDIKRIFGAVWADIKSGGYSQGASTITQQLIKNSHLTNEKTMMRKIQEAILALQLERQYEKDEILEMYLNFVYFGRGAYGIQAASRAYFGIDVGELTVPQAAVLIGILKGPGRYAPHLNMENCIKRRNTVLSQMEKYGYITAEQYEQYSKEEIVIVEKEELYDYGYYTDFVLEEGADLLGISVSDLMGGGYSVYTTLDSSLQQQLQEIYEKEDNFPASQEEEKVQSAAVIIDNATGAISAMIGGREHEGMRVYNRACARRQPGSCIQPVLVYAPAFENGSITSATMLDDYRKDFDGYSPTNFRDIYYGKVSVRKALSLSLNVPAVELLQQNEIEYSKSYAKRMGIVFDEDDKYLALALGGMKYGSTPIEIASAYRTFATGGFFQKGWCIKKICDSDGNVVYEHSDKDSAVLKDSTAFLITDILCDVSKQRTNALGTLGHAVACKTGTVGYNDIGYSDAWCSAYTKDYTVCVWMGYDRTDAEHFLPETVTGGSYPAKVAAEIFAEIIARYGYSAFEQPGTVTKVKIDGYTLERSGMVCLATGYTEKSNVLEEYFVLGTEPQNVSSYWAEPLQPLAVEVQFDELRNAEISVTAAQAYVNYCVYRKNESGEVLLGKVSAEEGKTAYIKDSGYTADSVYFVIPEHKTVFANGQALQGQKSREYTLH